MPLMDVVWDVGSSGLTKDVYDFYPNFMADWELEEHKEQFSYELKCSMDIISLFYVPFGSNTHQNMKDGFY